MGTDIHMVVETLIDGRWTHLDGEEWDERNYMVFAILANVRNGYGFAGVATHTPIEPLDEPRGWPKDFKAPPDKSSEDYGEEPWLGDHSMSWCTVKELAEWSGWGRGVMRSGVVSPAEYLTWKEKGRPDSWCGDVSGPRVEHISNLEMEVGIQCGKIEVKSAWENGGPSYYTSVSWIDSIAPNFKKWADGLYSKYPEARLVFGFDS